MELIFDLISLSPTCGAPKSRLDTICDIDYSHCTMSSSIPYPPLALASSSDSVFVASGSSLHLWTHDTLASTGRPSSSASHNTGLIRQIAVSPDGQHAATIADDKSLRMYSLPSLSLRSTRYTTKKVAHVSFSPNGVIVSDKVGDVYEYPLDPVAESSSKPKTVALVTDPTTNPEARLLIGHVSILTQHLLTPDGRHLITADRDGHIRVSRYPATHVVERYLFGSDGFISALHIPASRLDILLSAGGENSLRIWEWQSGAELGSVGIFEAVLPHRRARSEMRKLRKVSKRGKRDELMADGTFYEAPEGWILPSGQGVCVKKLGSIVVEGVLIVLFFSEG